jgi:tetrahydromethanopterin S-methyltransferase subunit C
MTIVALAFGASVYILVTQDPKTNLPDKATGIITGIVAALLGYLTGKGSK